jgi:eukaryotic-like serine/threonine-protein kinase
MPILPATRLGPYEILSAIGAGGMGEVYKARDTRLDRIVAIKVLPTHLADRAELRERFEREAKTIASLNHPHICTLYDIGHQDGTDFLVMEYLEGETLAQRLVRGPLPLEQVLQYATEISDALGKAHRKGITHRDLKPGNVMLTKSGTKLLDFGLAKLKQDAAPSTPESQLVTMRGGVTGEGTILGTLQYMAPEQVEGKTAEIDCRTDIFALGAVVYEMATGKKAFEGKSQASLIAKILEADPPPMTLLQPLTPEALNHVVNKCLAKEPEKRWQTASDLADELKWIAAGSPQIASAPLAVDRRTTWDTARGWLIWMAGSILIAALTGLAVWHLMPAPVQPIMRFTITLPPSQQLAGFENGPVLAISPDGMHLAYVATERGTQQIHLRSLDSLVDKAISGTEGAVNPFFSPDSQWLAYFAGTKLMRVSVNGGGVVAIGETSNTRGGSWSNQGTIAFEFAAGSLSQVPETGGSSQPLTRLEKGENSHRWPEFLPSGKAVIFSSGTAGGAWTNAQIAVQAVGTRDHRNLIQGGTFPRYANSGHLVYSQLGTLMAVPFDIGRLAVTGSEVPVMEGILQSGTSGSAQYSISSTGTLAYVSGGLQGGQTNDLVWVDRSGAEQALAAPPHHYQHPRLSPDGRQIALTISEQESQIWLYDLGRETLARFTFEGKLNGNPTWTPDGKRIAFQSNKDGVQNLFWQLADGSGEAERLTNSDHSEALMSMSPDGKLIAFLDVGPTTGYDIWVLQLADRKAQPFIRTPFNESAPRFSRDGRWIAYYSDESGRFEIYVQPYPGPGGKWQISTEGGTEPVWNPNGRELFYRSGDKMMAVDISTLPSFTAGKPHMLFQGPYVPTPLTFPNYDVSADGRRFLMLKSNGQAQAAATQINVVLNWFEELKQKVPAGRK